MTTIRPPAVAGQFYPARSRELEEMIRDWLESGPPSPSTVAPKALIVPHAGYIYSGEVAANAYRLLTPLHAVIQRVVLIGPAHRVPLTGLSMSGADWFETPLGKIPIDKKARLLLERYPQISIQDAPHAAEHSLEVQLPFLQVLLDQFELIPLVYGRVTGEEIADVLETLWGGPETLFVISSDLSHFLDDVQCREMDRETAESIEHLEVQGLHADSACGRKGIQALMLLARKRGYRIRLLELKNSGAVSGDLDRVVGYGAFVMEKETPADV